ncbi:hypothetical protein BC629DRAFT_1481697 [Irpex lacteus]|nr:hypothetical protein BC629DRAFT_1481697 [Irpex lacteus]
MTPSQSPLLLTVFIMSKHVFSLPQLVNHKTTASRLSVKVHLRPRIAVIKIYSNRFLSVCPSESFMERILYHVVPISYRDWCEF